MPADRLIHFLLRNVHVRGALIHGRHIVAEAARIHGLGEPVASLFGQVLLGSILLLSISKGGMRQVLQLDAPDDARTPIRRMLAESRQGAVRGYIDWNESTSMTDQRRQGMGTWLGHPVRLSTVRDLGIGQPYVSTIEHDSDFLADHLVHYLSQSVQIRADVVLQGGTGLLLEAMPGADESRWFHAMETLARIPDHCFEQGDSVAILSHFDPLDCQVLAKDAYEYRCDCNPKQMAEALKQMSPEQLENLMDEHGEITLSCQYCGKHYRLPWQSPRKQ